MATRFSQFRTVGPALVEQRSEPRHRITVTRAKVRKQGDASIDAILRDLSVYGCRLACTSEHPEGERVWLRLQDSLPVAGTVIWNNGNEMGCRFDAPIDRNLMRSLTLVIC
ncbi:PilZ domain-containing protein [Sphingomonas psychrotolerans]|uniref:PilZ domain-containing protein n=1 Tax=Sphingomonas psychrotolerans TaxID=1327635 RepID=A0ABU3N597_9SPHN|nr:PilZ domain-containing protein [Sphingomonas psychrotolerans]MDT8759652.1 PilZ domain-containing protein [Sphingomonas psychrotolerans]